MAHLPTMPRVRTRTAPAQHELAAGVPHVFIDSKGKIPPHYIPGYGHIANPQPGDIVNLGPTVKAGKFLQPVNPADVTKAADDPAKAQELAEKAAEAKAAEEAAAAAAAEKEAAKEAAKSDGKK